MKLLRSHFPHTHSHNPQPLIERTCMERIEVPQWMLWATVSHGNRFGHALTLQTVTKRSEPVEVGRWSWTGIGVPAPLIEDAEGRLCAVLTEHLVTRYGVAQGLFL